MNICIHTGSKCEHSQRYKQVWECTARVGIQRHLWYDICTLLNILLYTQRIKMWALARAQRYVRLHNNGSCTRVSIIFHMYTCEYVDVYEEVLSVSTRRDAHICKFAQHRFIYNSIYDMIYVHFWIYWCIQKESKCEHSQGHKHMWVRTTWVDTQEDL